MDNISRDRDPCLLCSTTFPEIQNLESKLLSELQYKNQRPGGGMLLDGAEKNTAVEEKRGYKSVSSIDLL